MYSHLLGLVVILLRVHQGTQPPAELLDGIVDEFFEEEDFVQQDRENRPDEEGGSEDDEAGGENGIAEKQAQPPAALPASADQQGGKREADAAEKQARATWEVLKTRLVEVGVKR